MKLIDLLEVIDKDIEFEIYNSNGRLGIFNTDDICLKDYLNNTVKNVYIEDERIVIDID